MARFNMDTADNYGNNGSNASFFMLKDDKDTARVRFLYDGIEDIEGYAVHEVEVGDKRRYVNCLREYNEPIEKCPFCAAQMRVIPKLFLKMYDVDTNECKIWERGKSYFQKMSSMCSRYKPLYNEVVEVERNGKKGDKQTSYTFYPVESSEFDIDSIEMPEALGTIVLDKTADEMETYLNIGDFPSSSASVASSRSHNDDVPFNDSQVVRRTPNNSGRRAF